MDASTKRLYRLHRRLDHDLAHCGLPATAPFRIKKSISFLPADASLTELLAALTALEPESPSLLSRLDALRELLNLPPFQPGIG